MTLWTIGHSTRSLDDFVALLQSHGIRRLVDVRTIARSRHNPQFNSDRLAKGLKKAGLAYLHMPQLGGLRKPRKDSVNAGWKNTSFRGYADYMQTEPFSNALEKLTASSQKMSTAIMCAEAVPWRCHRSLIADALAVRGWTVRHIMTPAKADKHRITAFAVIDQDQLTYPPPDAPQAHTS